ncbi:hypothetical protein AbraIFM66951_000868 [Aspergillus brasiliensis]|uniref:FHA domain-containing protein n=1 Tax=Aspergillus brasiliensis TaxID=319629 RepID=A0A9W5YI18_9EURO|nr:hypothetical protein AbraCBS73388_000878 [Aspergillus brasiliensis]GKZ42161.1 hypothetical protein AbraIFM66951_000868 [Aspergillus brasiliensis]
MPATQAIVTLRPLSISDDIPYRSLEFTSTNNHVNIGRASKRESKNLIPARNNGLFESRVMSRNHAKLWVCFDKQLVYIRDGGSMHGTWINGKKIPTEEDSVINHDDVVTFGSTVYRGSDTFPPLKVRCEFEWPDPFQRTVLATNTFCVPDDDESDTKEDSVPMVVASGSASEIDNSTPESDSDDQSVMEISSPLTSPLKRADARNCHVDACSETDQVGRPDGQEGSQLSPIDLEHGQHGQHEQPLVTPRMTPPSVIDLIDGPSNMAHDFDKFLQEADSASAMSSSDDEDSSWGEDDHAGSDDYDDDGEVDSQSSFRFNAEQLDEDEGSVRSSSLHVLGIRDLIASEASFAVEETNTRLDLGNDTSRSERHDRIGEDMAYEAEPREPELMAVRNPIPDLPSQSTGPSRITPTEAPPPILLQPTLSSPYGKTLDRSVPNYQTSPTTSYVDWWNPRTTANPSYSLHIPPTPQVPYADGPFVNNESFLLGETAPASNRAANPVVASMATPEIKSPEAATSDGHEIQETPMPEKQPDPILTPLPQMQRPETGSDDVQANKPLKRKAEDIDGPSGSSELDVATYPRDGVDSAMTSDSQLCDQETCYPDAQPQMLAGQQDTPSQLADLDSAKEPLLVDDVDEPANDGEMTAPPTKRAKTSSAGRFASHAATAALGVAIGAFGTIAALASLPPDYFQ